MTKEEVLEWMKDAHHVDTGWHEHDDCGNYYADEIYEKDGKLYKIPHSNHEPSTYYESKKPYHVIIPVVRKERMEYYYEEE